MTVPDEPTTPQQTPPPMPPPSAGYGTPPAGMPAAYASGAGSPPGTYLDPATGLALPDGTQLASVGRRIGAYFLSLVLVVVTLGIGYLIWGLIVWRKGTSPALSVLGMRCWNPNEATLAGFGRMALRDIVGGIVTGILGAITGLISFILFVAQREHRTLADMIGGTVVIHDPQKVLG